MRISNKQANLLANEIFERLKRTTLSEPSAETKQKLSAWKKYRDKMQKEKDKLSEEIDKHEKTLSTVIGKNNVGRIRGYWDEENILDKLREANTPTVSEIENKIILKAMFASEDDLEAFVDKLVAEYSKKKVKA